MSSQLTHLRTQTSHIRSVTGRGPGHPSPSSRASTGEAQKGDFSHTDVLHFTPITRASQVHNQPLARFLKVSEMSILVIEGLTLLSGARHLIPGPRVSVSIPDSPSPLGPASSGTASLGKAGLSLRPRRRRGRSRFRRSAIITEVRRTRSRHCLFVYI